MRILYDLEFIMVNTWPVGALHLMPPNQNRAEGETAGLQRE